MLLLLLLLLGQQMAAQVSSYTFSQSTQTYQPLSTSTVAHGANWSNYMVAVPLPFTFYFDGLPYTSVNVNTNGYVTFGTGFSTVSAPISSNAQPTTIVGVVAGFARSLIGAAQPIVYGIEGSGISRVFVVQWNNARRASDTQGHLTGDNINFQIRLYESSNRVEIRYGTCTAASTDQNNVQVGLRGTTNTDFNNRTSITSWATTAAGTANNAVVNSSNTMMPSSGLTFRYSPPCTVMTVPYTQNFESATTPQMPACTSVQTGQFGNTWFTSDNPGNGFTSKTLQYSYNEFSAADTWFYTHGILLTGGIQYSISYRYGTTHTFDMESLSVAMGTSPNAAAMNIGLATHSNITVASPQTNLVNFTPATSGVYYFGFYCFTPRDRDQLYVDDIAVNVSSSTGCPTTYQPANAATAVPRNTSLSWTAAAGATSYNVYFGASPAPPLVLSGTTSLTYNPGVLADNTTYYWKVSPVNGQGPTSCAENYFVTSSALPNCPTTYQPAPAATSVSRNTVLSWTAGGGATSYDVFFGNSPTPPLVLSGTTALTYNPGVLLG
ncbi:MAG TPA: hypothetical protein VGB67_14820, partial [Fibrella sp.]